MYYEIWMLSSTIFLGHENQSFWHDSGLAEILPWVIALSFLHRIPIARDGRDRLVIFRADSIRTTCAKELTVKAYVYQHKKLGKSFCDISCRIWVWSRLEALGDASFTSCLSSKEKKNECPCLLFRQRAWERNILACLCRRA